MKFGAATDANHTNGTNEETTCYALSTLIMYVFAQDALTTQIPNPASMTDK